MKSKLFALTLIFFSGFSAFACTDFSGDWSGECENLRTGKKEQRSLKAIQHKCLSLSVYNTSYAFGQDNVNSRADGKRTVTEITSIDWNKDQTEVLWWNGTSGRVYNVNETVTGEKIAPGDRIVRGIGKSTWKMQDDKLVVTDYLETRSLYVPQATAETAHYDNRCVYKKM